MDARFRGQPSSTGVHNWAGEVLAALPALGIEVRELRPVRGSGVVGHAWEQLVLPARVRGEHSALPLLSPCNWGPLAVRDQVLVLHDVAPLVVPQHFSRAYVALARVQLPLLARRVRTLLTVSEGARRDIIRVLGVPAAKVVVVGMGTRPLPPPAEPALPEPYFAFIGAHDSRKNLSFLLDLWPRVHAATGAHLVVTRRPSLSTTTTSAAGTAPWCTELVDPSDAVLSAVLAGARALLWPSVHEGFGMPLLEAYQQGTGFISADTGAARELVRPGDAVLALEPDRWVQAIVARVAEDPGDRAQRRQVAGAYRWEDVAARVLTALQQ